MARPMFLRGVALASMLLFLGGTNQVMRAHAMIIPIATCDKASLDAAISSAGAGDTISFGCSGTIVDTVTLTRTLTLDASGQQVTLDGGGAGTVVTISSGAAVTLTALTVAGGSGFNGGGIANSGTLTLINSTVDNNSAFNGAGIQNSGALTLINSTLSNNSAASSGSGGGLDNEGGLQSTGKVTITNSTIGGNSAGSGGGIYNNVGLLTLTGSTVSGNSGNGGGILNNGGTMTLTNSTVSGNSVSGTGSGGGVGNTGQVTLRASTIADNSASPSFGGGISNAPFGSGIIVTTTESIVAHNAGGDCAGPGLTSRGYNLVGAGCGLTAGVNNDQVGVDPQLGPLQNNGGPTFTQALLAGSPAINVVPKSDVASLGLTTDQRGYPRPGGIKTMADIGAYETQSILPTSTATNSPSATSTPSPTATSTSTATGTATPTPSATATNKATSTNTSTATAMSKPTSTGSPTASALPTGTPTMTASPSSTNMPLPTGVSTATATPTAAPTSTTTATPMPPSSCYFNAAAQYQSPSIAQGGIQALVFAAARGGSVVTATVVTTSTYPARVALFNNLNFTYSVLKGTAVKHGFAYRFRLDRSTGIGVLVFPIPQAAPIEKVHVLAMTWEPCYPSRALTRSVAFQVIPSAAKARGGRHQVRRERLHAPRSALVPASYRLVIPMVLALHGNGVLTIGNRRGAKQATLVLSFTYRKRR